MEAINKDLILAQVPLFAGLSAEKLQLIKERSNVVEYKKNQVIYEEGSSADAFFCIILGRAIIFTRDKFGSETILEYLHRGKYFGIISLLTGGAHSVTARALNDSLLLVIKKDDFNFILKMIPELAIDLSRTLSRRLKDKSLHQKTIFESTLISVFSSYSRAGKTIYGLNLSLSIGKETGKSVIILDIRPNDNMHSLPQRLGIEDNYKIFDLAGVLADLTLATKDFVVKTGFGIDLLCVNYQVDDESSAKKLLGILSLLVNEYHYIVLDLPSVMDQFVFRILNQSDAIHILTSPDPADLRKTRRLIAKLKTDFNFQEAKINIIINQYKLSKLNYQEESQLLGGDIYATLPEITSRLSERLVLDDPASEYAKAVRRISRKAGDTLVGLALGVGVGYGFCHIGVLKVIEEEKIPVDIITGSSVGSVIASFWASGKPAKEILQIVKEEFKQPKYTWGLIDLTFPMLGFIKGNKLYGFLKRYLGNKTFCDLKLPLKIIASDIRKKESIVLDKGLLIDAVMASCAMPGVFRPFKLKEELLLDGGVINPLPTEALFKLGVKKIIAVNVTPSKEDIIKQYERIKQELTASRQAIKEKKWFDLKRYFQEIFKNNILDIIFSSIEAMQSEMAIRQGQLADIVLHPDTSGLHWLELYRAEEFAQRGEEETRRNLDKIWKVIKE